MEVNEPLEKTENTPQNPEGRRLVLHRKWRSRNFEEIVGQEHVVRTLKNALAMGRIAPAYLFCGPRGTGKTSMARILAKALNCLHPKEGEPCNKCHICLDTASGSFLDVIEMDAASHTQVDKIREFIVEKVNFRPVEAKRKIYIIDEVHKLSSYSFDALLKTIEEPPPFVVFMLATTEPEKLPPTIISRCQRFDFKRISIAEIIDRLKYISHKENFCVEDGALNLIAQASDGALRDALVILEQAVSFSKDCITAGEIAALLGMTGTEVLFSFAEYILDRNTMDSLKLIDEIYSSGRDLHRLCVDLLDHFRKLLIMRMVRDAESILQISDSYYEKLSSQAFRFKPNHLLHIIKELMELHTALREMAMDRLLWEAAAVKLTRWELAPSIDGLSRRIDKIEEALQRGEIPEGIPAAGRPVQAKISASASPLSIPADRVQKPIKQESSFEKPVSPPVKPADSGADMSSAGEIPRTGSRMLNNTAIWHQILRDVKKEKMQLLPILQSEGEGRLEEDAYHLPLKGNNTFNRDFIEKNRRYLESLLEKIVGKKVRLVLEQNNIKNELFIQETKPHQAFVQEVIDVFGAASLEK